MACAWSAQGVAAQIAPAARLERFAIVMKHNLHVGCSWRIRLA
jgi:hypothetical protein